MEKVLGAFLIKNIYGIEDGGICDRLVPYLLQHSRTFFQENYRFERAAAVEAASTALAAAEKKTEDLKVAWDSAKEAQATASEALKATKKSLDDFLPELKEASEALDEAKGYLQDFVEGALATSNPRQSQNQPK
jgi:membrane protein involved in colicin uptake